MIDSFFGGITDEMQAVLDALAKQNQQQQDPLTGTQYADAKFREGLEANNAADAQAQAQAQTAQQQPPQQQIEQLPQQMPQMQQLLNPVSKAIIDQILAYKNGYEGADAITRANNPTEKDETKLTAAADALRADSHKAADKVRQLAANLGVDLTGYEDVGYEDAFKKLQTQQGKELMDIMSGQGKYGRTAEQYYQDEYLKLGADDYSARNARRIAGERAQRYQTDRVTYLRNAFNMYGRDGNYINDNGMAMIQEIAGEMPEVANVYWQAYKRPDQAQDRLETVYDKERGYQNDFDLKNLEFMQNAFLQDLTYKQNLGLQGNASQLRIKEADKQLDRDKDLYSWQKDEDFRAHVNTSNFDSVQAVNVAYAKFKNGQRIAAEIGLKGDAANKLAAAFAGVQIPKNGGKLDDKSIDNLTKIAKTYDETEKNILSQLDKENLNLSDEEIAELQKTLNYVREQKAKIQKVLLGISGIDGETSDDATSLNKDLKHDLPIIQGAYADFIRRGYTHDKAIEFIRKNMEHYGYAGTQIEAAIGALAR